MRSADERSAIACFAASAAGLGCARCTSPAMSLSRASV
jgi:hypothetical protein